MANNDEKYQYQRQELLKIFNMSEEEVHEKAKELIESNRPILYKEAYDLSLDECWDAYEKDLKDLELTIGLLIAMDSDYWSAYGKKRADERENSYKQLSKSFDEYRHRVRKNRFFNFFRRKKK